MTFLIDFTLQQPVKKAANTNVHDHEYWGFAHELAARSTPINDLPRQLAVHYIYEHMNRPWLPERQRLDDATKWMQKQAPDLQIQV